MTATPPPGALPNGSSPETPFSVAKVSGGIKQQIDRLGEVWVEGEITQWSVRASGVFAKVKDLEAEAALSFTVWSRTQPDAASEFKQGDRVLLRAKVDFWVNRGDLSLNVREIRHVGLGDLFERLERLRKQLAAEGLFDPARKRPLPFLPNRIGLVTGRDSDAEKDVVRNAQLRWPGVRFEIRHALVQGERAAAEVTAAILALDADPEVDVIIVARGGGDFLHLLPFSDETLIRTVAAATTPIVSAIGHENDHPILDDVADLRASTPTDAAKRVVPDIAEELSRVVDARARIRQRVTSLIATEVDRVAQLRSRPVLADGRWIVDTRTEEVFRWVTRGAELLDRRIEQAESALEGLAGRLRALSPLATLQRGYAIAVLPDGHAVRTATEAPSGTKLTLRLADGGLAATVD